MVWAGIMQDTGTPLHVFDSKWFREYPEIQEVLEPYVHLFRGAVVLNSFLWTTMCEYIGLSWLMSIWKVRIFKKWLSQPILLI